MPPTASPSVTSLVGVFFEDISRAADGGLYAELMQNGDFEYTAADHGGWSATTAWKSSKPITIATDKPLSSNNPHYAVMQRDTLFNIGWEGIPGNQQCYDFSIFARTIDNAKNQLDVALVSPEGVVLAQDRLKIVGQQWKQYTLQLSTDLKKVVGSSRWLPTAVGGPQGWQAGRRHGLALPA